MGKWEMVRLSDVVDQAITGEWGTECADGDVCTKVLRTTNFTNSGVINYDKVVERNIPFDKVQKKKLEKDDIILEKSGGSDSQPVGRVVFFDNKQNEVFLCNNFTQVLRIKQDIACPRYIFIYLFSLHQNGTTELLQNKTTGIRNLQVKRYMALEIPLPPLEVQQQIADVLDRASALIERRKAQIDKLDLLVKAQFIEMFGDPIRNEKGFSQKQGITFLKLSNGKTLPNEKRLSQGIPAYGGNGISWHTDKPLCTDDTLVVGRVGFQSGNVHYVKGPLWVTDNAMFISEYDRNEYDLMFLYSLMEHINFTRFQDAGDLKKITQKPFMQMEYINPPLDIQRSYTTFIEQVETQKTLLRQSLAKLEQNYKSLMQKCFRGEIFN